MGWSTLKGYLSCDSKAHRNTTLSPPEASRAATCQDSSVSISSLERSLLYPATSCLLDSTVTASGAGSTSVPLLRAEGYTSSVPPLRRVTSCREEGTGGQVERTASATRSTPRGTLDSLRSYGDERESVVSSPSPLLSPSATVSNRSSPPHRTLPSFKVMGEGDARLIFRSLAEAVSKSRYNSSINSSSSILFGSCNEPCCRPLTFFAPEMLQQDQGTVWDLDQLEIWSLGILLYKMLTGKQPFEGNTDAHTLRRILVCKVRFPVFPLKGSTLSVEVKGLVRWMLSLEPTERPTISQVLGHPWVAKKQ